MRRVWAILTRSSLSALDVAVAIALWLVIASSYSGWVKALVLLPVLGVGATSVFGTDHWWKPRPRCEVKGCPHFAGGQTCATRLPSGEKVFRLVCEPHWGEWRSPGVQGDSAEARDELMKRWGWPGEAWWRD